MSEKKNDNEKIIIKARLSFLIEIEADDKKMLEEAIEDIKFHFKQSRTSSYSVSDGESYSWRIIKQRKDDITVKQVKEIKNKN